MSSKAHVLVALSGGVDSAVAALLLRDAGHVVECLHMSNWEADDGYCDAAGDLRDARRVADMLGLPLHRVSFAQEYRQRVFDDFLREHAAGRTPNPDVLCNREIKFGALRAYSRRLGADRLATGHYARLEAAAGGPRLLKARDRSKDQSYFLHAVAGADLEDVLFPLGGFVKSEVRTRAREAGLPVAAKKDSTGICFIGERPFASFLARYLPPSPGPIVTADGATIGTHRGLPFYTIGQRQGLKIGGRRGYGPEPWYVAAKRPATNELVAVQGRRHALLFQDRLTASDVHWIGAPPAAWRQGGTLALTAKTRYRQPDRPCTVTRLGGAGVDVRFSEPEWAVTPGQFVVFYDGERCLGGARIENAWSSKDEDLRAVQAR